LSVVCFHQRQCNNLQVSFVTKLTMHSRTEGHNTAIPSKCKVNSESFPGSSYIDIHTNIPWKWNLNGILWCKMKKQKKRILTPKQKNCSFGVSQQFFYIKKRQKFSFFQTLIKMTNSSQYFENFFFLLIKKK